MEHPTHTSNRNERGNANIRKAREVAKASPFHLDYTPAIVKQMKKSRTKKRRQYNKEEIPSI